MSISLDKIDIIMERANVSYQEAQEALERNHGDLVDTLIDLEKKDKLKKEITCSEKKHYGNTVVERMIEQFKIMHSYQFLIKKQKQMILKLPLTIAALLIVLAFPFSLIFLGLLLLTKFELSIKTKDKEYVINDLVKRNEDE
ncbi:MAG: hypothetical protein MJA31_17590 [Clostridia bacterium]|nr:hypothetical protein [Clostridia bacterium]